MIYFTFYVKIFAKYLLQKRFLLWIRYRSDILIDSYQSCYDYYVFVCIRYFVKLQAGDRRFAVLTDIEYLHKILYNTKWDMNNDSLILPSV